MTPKFVHLHVHSMFSLLDGLSKIDEIITRTKECGLDSVALTDHGVMYGAIEFYKKAMKAGIKPIIGSEVYVVDGDRKEKKVRDNIHHLVLLAETDLGYRNLVKLVSDAQTEGFYYRPRTDHEMLREYHEGLICLSSCLGGEIGQALLAKDTDKAVAIANEYNEIFGQGNFFLEIQPHLKMPEQIEVNARLVSMSQQLGIPLVATQDSHYPTKEDARIHDVLLAVQTGVFISDEKRFRMDQDDFSLCSAEEMAEKLGDIGAEAMENTWKIAERCKVEIELNKIQLPAFPLPPTWDDPFHYLEAIAWEGVLNRFGLENRDEIDKRLEYELSVIKQTGFATYFLIVQDFVNWAKGKGIAVGPGRGSAAGSLLSYVLGITNIDPIKYGLIFERFLNPDRIAPPDIDIDLADHRRDEVIQYVTEKYGQNHVAQIITLGTMASRTAVRDTGRALGYEYMLCDKLSKMIPADPNQDKEIKEANRFIQHCIENVEEVRDIYNSDSKAKEVLDVAARLEGTARHHGVHASAILITPNGLTDHLPIQHASDGERVVTQYDMHSVEDLGLLKMDFLGLSNLTIIEETIKSIKRDRGITIDIDEIPLDDKATFTLLQAGATSGVFQLSSPGMKKWLKELKPNIINDIMTMVALYRPGPMDLIPSYIARKYGKEKIEYLHPSLEPVLKNTYGIMIYQEQLIEAVRVLAGFTRAEGDILRKATGKKDKKLIDATEKKFKDRAKEHGTPTAIANAFWALVVPFSNYSFNLSHSACYGIIAYQTAYLKANYPMEFMAAFLDSETKSIEGLTVVIEECRRMKISLLPPDINESDLGFTVVGKKIRFGLAAIKNIGAGLVSSIVAERDTNGPYTSIVDLIARVEDKGKGMNKRPLEFLAKSGALDSISERGNVLGNLEALVTYAKEKKNNKGALLLPFEFAKMQPANTKEKIGWEKELLGFYVTDHPLAPYRTEMIQQGILAICDLQLIHESSARIGGIITDIRKIVTKKGNNMIFATVEDMTGKMRIVVFPQIYNFTKSKWEKDAIVIVKGKLDTKGEMPNLLCDDIETVDNID